MFIIGVPIFILVGCWLFHFPAFSVSCWRLPPKDNNRTTISGVEGHFLIETHRPGGQKSEGIGQKENQQRCG